MPLLTGVWSAKKKLARNLGPMWEGPRPSGITPARGAPQCMAGGSGSSQTRLGARLGARNPEIVSEFSTKKGGVEPLLAGVLNGMEPFGSGRGRSVASAAFS